MLLSLLIVAISAAVAFAVASVTIDDDECMFMVFSFLFSLIISAINVYVKFNDSDTTERVKREKNREK